MFEKIKVYYFYLINKNSRNFFFILIWRKILKLFIKNNKEKFSKIFILKWCGRRTISEVTFIEKLI